MNTNYEHPLLSLDFIARDARPPAPPAHQIAVPGGHLVVSEALIKRGKIIGTSPCIAAVDMALPRFEAARARFCRRGVPPLWAGSMRHWTARLRRQEGERTDAVLRARDVLRQQEEHDSRCRKLWRDARTAARRAGLPTDLTFGGVPREPRALHLGLQQLLSWLCHPAHRSSLAACGFDAAMCDELLSTRAALLESIELRTRLLEDSFLISHDVQVIRGALIGDLIRLSQLAPAVLLRDDAAALQVRNLFPCWKRTSQRAAIKSRRPPQGDGLHDLI